jgi:outer membrane receptor protein involved in Fe transport
MRSATSCIAALALIALSGPAAADATWQGRKLSEYLDFLNGEGSKIIYTSDLVADDMRLSGEPTGDSSADGLAGLLHGFGLTVTAGPAGSLLVVQLPPEVEAAAQADAPAGVAIPEIVVTSSLHRLDYSPPLTHTYLDRELATRIPTTAEEAVRLTNRLPGTANGGVSSRNHIRGGEVNEVLFLLDGLRLYEPYHLKDFQAIATIVNSSAIGGMDFYTGAYPAHFGDRMSGVLSIELREPEKPVETEFALSFFNASIISLGTFGHEQQGDWLLSARRGNLDLIVDVVDPDFGSPDYRDFLGHVGWEFGPRAVLSASFLVSDDKLALADAGRGERATAEYGNHVFWLKWGAEWTDALSSETIAAVSDISDTRSGSLDLPGIVSGSLDERRKFLALEFRQDWTWVMSPNRMLRFGIDLKDLDAEYQVTSAKTVEPPFDGILDNQPSSAFDFDLDPAGAQYAAYMELRWRFSDTWTIDLGLRWDQQNYTTSEDDKQYSPRAGILYQPGDRTEIRFGWGQYYQAQEINELQVSDGVGDFFPAQHAEHFVLNLRHAFRSGINASVSAYRKSFRSLRPRFENSFNTLTLLPELQFDRVRVDASGAEAIGAEVTLNQGSSEEDVLWWLSYAWSEVEDATADGDIKRSWDQTHTVKAGMSWRWGPWNFSAAGEVHTGWPKTEMTGDIVTFPGGGTGLVVGVSQRNDSRYSVFHAVDVRVSREFDLARADLTAFLEITNLYDRANPCCTEYSLLPDGSLSGSESNWLPLVPSLGVVWRF